MIKLKVQDYTTETELEGTVTEMVTDLAIGTVDLCRRISNLSGEDYHVVKKLLYSSIAFAEVIGLKDDLEDLAMSSEAGDEPDEQGNSDRQPDT